MNGVESIVEMNSVQASACESNGLAKISLLHKIRASLKPFNSQNRDFPHVPKPRFKANRTKSTNLIEETNPDPYQAIEFTH